MQSHHFMANRWRKKMGKLRVFIFLGFKITSDGDCHHKIKRFLLTRRKALTKLDSILKSRGITCIVKTMNFPVVMQGFEGWTRKKAEHRRTEAFKLWCWRRLLRISWKERDQSKLKEINSSYLLEGLILKLKLQNFGHLMSTHWKRP